MSKNLIFEDLSISNIVEKVTNEIASVITDRINKEDGKYHLMRGHDGIVRYLVKNAEMHFDNEWLFSKINKISVEAYFFKDKTELIKNANKIPFGGDDFLDDGIIEIRCYGIGNELSDEFLKGTLSHELKHAYQSSLYDIGAQNILTKATNIISDVSIIDCGFKHISELLYYFSKSEIDANIESLNQELNVVKPTDISEFNSQSLNEFKMHKEKYESCKIYYADDETCDKLKNTYGKTFNELSHYIENGIRYFNEKIRKVFARYEINKNLIESVSMRRLGLFIR